MTVGEFGCSSPRAAHALRRAFTEGELALDIPGFSSEGQLMSLLFSCKESAFKSCAQALRSYYRRNDEPLFFETRDFEVLQDGTARGIAKVGDAQSGLEALGIAKIQLNWAIADGIIATCAAAIRQRGR